MTSEQNHTDELIVTAEHPGRYRSQGEDDPELGRGGIGRVMLSFDACLGREVAVKELLSSKDASESAASNSLARTTRFLREARVTGQLEHPNIVPVYELGTRPDGTVYYTMKVVRGRTLAEALRGCATLADRMKLLRHFIDMCNAVAYAHSRGVVHRDIKPQNVMLGSFGETVVLDWGLAKVQGQEEIQTSHKSSPVLGSTDSDSTRMGDKLGTPMYMSPEQSAGLTDEIDEASDVWSLGVVLKLILYGYPNRQRQKVEFSAATEISTLDAAQGDLHTAILDESLEVPGELTSVCQKALRHKKSERYASAKDLADEVEAFLTGGRVQAYEYSLWDLLRRFVATHKAALLATVAVAVAVVVSLVVASHLKDRQVRKQILALAGEVELYEQRMESLDKTRKAAFDAYDREDFREGATKWKQATFQTGSLEQDYGELLSRLAGLMTNQPFWNPGIELKIRLLKKLLQVSSYAGREDLAAYYQKQLSDADLDGSQKRWLSQPAIFTVLSLPNGAELDLFRFEADERGVLQGKKERSLGKAPIDDLRLEAGSYLIEARLDGRLTTRFAFLAQRGEEKALSIPLPKTGVIPAGMVYVPPGEFITGMDEPENMRRYTGSIPRHASYTDGFVISATEVTFAAYLPFLKEQIGELLEACLPKGPYFLKLDKDSGPILKYRGQRRGWGEKFVFAGCPGCEQQDWRNWPVAVSSQAAEAYAKWKSSKLAAQGYELTLRLPTEPEWEKAARGADGRKYPCGDNLPDGYALTTATHGRSFTGLQEVGSHPGGRSVYAADDLAGSAWEWVRLTPEHGMDDLALKGGSFSESPVFAAATARITERQVTEAHASGFRLAAHLPGSEACPLEGELPGSEIVAAAQAKACRDAGHKSENQTNYDKALSAYQRMLSLYLQARGRQHRDTASSYAMIGAVYARKGSYDQSLEYYAKALDIDLKTMGPRHLNTARTYNGIGNIHFYKGSYDQALAYQIKALTIMLETLGPEHAATANTYSSIGIAYSKKGSGQQALEAYQKSLKARLKALGPKHPETGGSYLHIGTEYRRKGDYDQALEYYEKALDIALGTLGADHLDTARCHNNIGAVYLNKGLFDLSLDHLIKGLNIKLKALGPRHPSTVTPYLNIGLVYRQKGSYQQSLEYQGKALSVSLEVLGPRHPETAGVYNSIGISHFDNGVYDLALENFKKTLDIRIEALGPRHPRTAQAYNNMGVAHLRQDSYDQALEYYEKALDIRVQTLGPEHPHSATPYNNIGEVHLYRGSWDQALEFFDKALNIRLKALGAQHPKTALSYHNIGHLHFQKGTYDQALENFGKALEIRLKVLGAQHPDTAWLYTNIGNSHYLRGSYRLALQNLQKALDIHVARMGPANTDAAGTHLTMAQSHRKLGDEKKAIQHDELASTHGLDLCQEGSAWACAIAAVASCRLGPCDHQALSLARKGIQLTPRDPNVVEAEAFILLQQGQTLESRRRYCKLRSLRPVSDPVAKEHLEKNCPRK